MKCVLTHKLKEAITEAIKTVGIPSEDLIEELQQVSTMATKAAKDYKVHLLRTMHEYFARSTPSANQRFLIKDWVPEFLPLQYRETQSDVFGKKGLQLAHFTFN